jgi:hypothetical protein
MQIMFLQRGVLLRLVQHPWASAPLLVRRASERCHGISRTLNGAKWPLQRVSTLMTISKGELFVSFLCGGSIDLE